MWRRRFRSRDISAVCSDGGDEDIWLTEVHTVRYPQRQGKIGFFSNVTMILPPLSLVTDHPASFSVAGGASRDRILKETDRNWQDCRIMPSKTQIGSVQGVWPPEIGYGRNSCA